MTPFGAKLREMCAERGLTLKEMAHALDVSPAYLSALEHGKRGAPTWSLVQRIITYFNVIWDARRDVVSAGADLGAARQARYVRGYPRSDRICKLPREIDWKTRSR